tara:strand:+ start:1881 stop:2654 length:774 start_codon:yes stop_codon:yes gene_type:complete
MIKKNNFINEKAIIGKSVKIEPFSFIDENVIIGDDCWVGNNVTIYSGARIGNNVKIFPGAVISAVPQDLKFDGEDTLVEIGDNTIIRECATINRGTIDTNKTIIENDCLIMAYVHIAHDCIVKNNSILVNAVQIGGHSIIDEHAIIGGGSVIHQFTKIGKYSMTAGGSVIRKDIPPYCKAGKNPLKYMGINSIGLKRKGFSKNVINNIQEIYRILYFDGLNNSEATSKISNDIIDSNEKNEILGFISKSDRGLIKGK